MNKRKKFHDDPFHSFWIIRWKFKNSNCKNYVFLTPINFLSTKLTYWIHQTASDQNANWVQNFLLNSLINTIFPFNHIVITEITYLTSWFARNFSNSMTLFIITIFIFALCNYAHYQIGKYFNHMFDKQIALYT